jgi:hypothetical protein
LSAIISRDVADVLAHEADERAEVVLLHLRARPREPLAPHAVEVDARLPVRRGGAEHTARVVLVRLADEAVVVRHGAPFRDPL